ncbi:MAG: hypothetical protein AAFX06_12035 [Planctomycetota bacterium]
MKTASLTVCLCFMSAFGIACGEDKQPSVEITDSKLFSINYGIDSLEHWIAKLGPNDRSRRQSLLRDHGRLQTRFDRLPASEELQYTFIRKRLKETRERLISIGTETRPQSNKTSQAASPSTLTDDVRNRLANIALRLRNLEQDEQRYRTGNPKQKQRVRSDASSLQVSFERLPSSAHPDYLAIEKRIQRLVAALEPDQGPLSLSSQEVTETLNAFRKKYYETLELPRARDLVRNRELTAEEVDGFVAKSRAFTENADRDLPRLKHLLDATGKDSSLVEWVETKSIDRIRREVSVAKETIDRAIERGIETAKRCSELDLEKHAYTFNNDSIRQNNEQLFTRTARTIDQAIRLADALELPSTWTQRREELRGYVDAYHAKLSNASHMRSLPEEVGTKELHKIATDVFKNRKYGVGKVVKQIVNTKVTPRDRTEHKVFEDRLETIVRVWDEYQVTTVEEEDGKLFLYRNNLAKFSRAPRTTPIGTWILQQRFKSGEIARENVVAKDAQASQGSTDKSQRH